MSNNIYRLLNLTGLIILSYFIGNGDLSIWLYLPNGILLWNAIEGVRVEEVVIEDKFKDVQIACKELRICSLEQLVQAQEMVIKNYKTVDKNEIYEKVNKIISNM